MFFAINDSGDEPIVYLMTSNGVVFHKIFVSGAKNVDWEDLSSDGDFLYIGDIGNKSGIVDRQIRTEIGEWWRFF